MPPKDAEGQAVHLQRANELREGMDGEGTKDGVREVENEGRELKIFSVKFSVVV